MTLTQGMVQSMKEITMKTNDVRRHDFEELIEEATSTPFTGWDFGYLTKTGRVVEAPRRWNYYNMVRPWLEPANTVLDMGTGGGEILSRFRPLPESTYATESHQPNIQIARKRLEPLGVQVVDLKEQKHPPFNADLPFEDNFFDRIINRHEGYAPAELLRILKKEGKFITQQVGSLNALNLRQFLMDKTATVLSNWNLHSAVSELGSKGFRVIAQMEEVKYVRFYDVGAVAYYLKAIPFIIRGFTIEKYRDRLWGLHKRIHRDGYYDAMNHRFIIVAEKPGPT